MTETWCPSCRAGTCGAHSRSDVWSVGPGSRPDWDDELTAFVAQPSPEDYNAAITLLGYDPMEDGLLHCDYCDKVETADDLTEDWNPETGCHLSCEANVCDDCFRTDGTHNPNVEH